MSFQDRKQNCYINAFVNENKSLPVCELYFRTALGGDYSSILKRYYNRLDKRFFKLTRGQVSRTI